MILSTVGIRSRSIYPVKYVFGITNSKANANLYLYIKFYNIEE